MLSFHSVLKQKNDEEIPALPKLTRTLSTSNFNDPEVIGQIFSKDLVRSIDDALACAEEYEYIDDEESLFSD